MKGNKRFINDNGKLKREKTSSPPGIAPQDKINQKKENVKKRLKK